MNQTQTHAASQAEPSVVRGCTGKKAYASWQEANVALRHTVEHGRRRCYTGERLHGYRLEPYRCRTCRQWHIGHQAHSRKRRGGRR
jgi:hypothetical protein